MGQVTRVQGEILGVLRQLPEGATTGELCVYTDRSSSGVHSALQQLFSAGHLTRTRTTLKGHPHRYKLGKRVPPTVVGRATPLAPRAAMGSVRPAVLEELRRHERAVTMAHLVNAVGRPQGSVDYVVRRLLREGVLGRRCRIDLAGTPYEYWVVSPQPAPQAAAPVAPPPAPAQPPAPVAADPLVQAQALLEQRRAALEEEQQELKEQLVRIDAALAALAEV